MGKQSAEALVLGNIDELVNYLRANHSAYVTYEGKTLYLTDANDIYWRAQDTEVLNEKGHYTDCSTLVPTVSEFVADPFLDGKTLTEAFADLTFYASIKE
jgi:hypothetical protein